MSSDKNYLIFPCTNLSRFDVIFAYSKASDEATSKNIFFLIRSSLVPKLTSMTALLLGLFPGYRIEYRAYE